MECRLEDFSPELVKEVLDFCDLDADPSVEREIQDRYDMSRKTARSGQVNSEEMRLVLQWIQPTLERLGYLVQD